MMGQVEKVSAAAKSWLDRDVVIIDTETTGLDNMAQVVEVSVIDCSGKVLIDTLVKPWQGDSLFACFGDPGPLIPAEAAAIHGITDEMLADAPIWDKVHAQFCEVIAGRSLLIYNAQFDARLLGQSAEFVGLPQPLDVALSVGCAMEGYAEYRGEWNNYRNNYKWHKLTIAAEQMGVDTSGMVAHRALGDCQMTLGLIKAMVGVGAKR